MIRFVPLLALCWASAAHATTGLAWKWEPDTTRRYLLTGSVAVPYVLLLQQEQNYDVRLSGIAVQLVTTCKVAEVAGKTGWEINCTLDDVSITAKPLTTDAG